MLQKKKKNEKKISFRVPLLTRKISYNTNQGKSVVIHALLVIRRPHSFTCTTVRIDVRTKTNMLLEEIKIYAKLETPQVIKSTKIRVNFYF